MNLIDLENESVRELNARLHVGNNNELSAPDEWRVSHPHGKHCLAVGLQTAHKISIEGHAGHYCGVMAQAGNLVICGDADDGLGDSIYEARIYVRGKTGALGADCVEKEMTA
jgi:glutamate synthase domain-containing protein 3